MRAALDCRKAAQCKVHQGSVVSLTRQCSFQPTREKLGKEPSECEEEELASILVRAIHHWNGQPWQTNIAWLDPGKSAQCLHTGTHRQGTWWKVKAKNTLPSSAVGFWGYYYQVTVNVFRSSQGLPVLCHFISRGSKFIWKTHQTPWLVMHFVLWSKYGGL